MAAVKSLTVDEARKNPSMFMYVFATDEYLSAISSKYAKIIRGKRANQEKLLKVSADEYLGDWQKWTQYKDAIKQGFHNIYGMTPLEALVRLALGEEVAGRNWNEGVYGVGALYPDTFANVTINGQAVTVDKTTGHIYAGTTDITDTQDGLMYAKVGKNTMLFRIFSKQIEGYVFEAEYYKAGNKYYAKTYSTENGTFNARNGSEVSATEAGSVWENIKLGTFDFLEWLKSLLSIFGINITSTSNSTQTLNAKNTLPNQTADGYVQESGMSEAAAIALMAVAGGTLLAGGFFRKKKSN